MAHWAFRVNLVLVLILSDYRGPIYMGSNMTPWVLQGYTSVVHEHCLKETNNVKYYYICLSNVVKE